MIDLYAGATPNVPKVEIMLEEIGLAYRVKPIDVWKREQFSADFVALNPNGKIPTIVDYDVAGGYAVFESGAILHYLAEKSGRFLPGAGKERYDVMQWLVFQVANFGPANGQFVHFDTYAGPCNDYSLSRYATELKRQYGVLERRLGDVPYLGGQEFSIADIRSGPIRLSARLDSSFGEAPVAIQEMRFPSCFGPPPVSSARRWRLRPSAGHRCSKIHVVPP